MLAFWPFYQIQLWTCLSDHHSSRSRRTIFLKKAGSLERTAFVHSSMQRRNKTLWVLWNRSETWKLLYYFFTEKMKQNCFLQQVFLIYEKTRIAERRFLTGLQRGYFFWGEGAAIHTQATIKPCQQPLHATEPHVRLTLLKDFHNQKKEYHF